MDVRLPDGTIIQNVPDGTTKADLVTKLQSNGMAVPSEWLAASAPAQPPTDRQRLLSSAPMRLAKGMKDPMDGAAQLLQRIIPEGAVNAVNRAADAIGGEGTFLGDVLGIKGMSRPQLTNDIRSSDQEYEKARAASGQSGFDAVRFTGNIVSPVNAATGRLVPALKAAAPVATLARQGAVAGAAGAATQPVTGDDYWTEKGGQVAAGAVTGAVVTPILSKAAESVAKVVRERLRNGAIKTPEAIQYEIKASLQRDDIDVGQIPKQVMDRLTSEAQAAMSAGKEIDAAALMRKMDFDRVGVKPLQGQLTRDPTQYARERDLRGIQGVGEPIANRLNEQAGTIAGKFRKATAGAPNTYDAGDRLVQALQSKDKQMSGEVRAAYDAFRESTGKDLPIPMDGIKSGFRDVVDDFDDHIPSAVRKKFEEIVSGPKPAHSHGAKAPAPAPLQILGPSGEVLSDLTPKPTPKTLSIDDAEKLIHTINVNYNPADKPQALALDKLRKHVQDAIIGTTESGEGMEAATLANFARGKAADRFNAIRAAPALKAAINKEAPDDFVRKYVINGKVRELNKLAELVGPEGQKTMAQQLMRHIEKSAFGVNAAGDGAGTQAGLNKTLDSIGKNKLNAILGPEQTDELFALGRVMAYIQQEPAGSAVNRSNTGAAVANLLSKVGGAVKGAPYINDVIVKPVASFRQRGEVANALAGALPKQSAQLDPQTINMLTRLLAPAPVATGAALGYSVR